MGLRDWAVRRKLNQQFHVWKLKLEAERLKPAGEVEASMPVWLHTVLVIFSGGALAAAADALTNGFTADKAGFTRLASAAFAGGLVALVAWLKQSPIAPSSTATAPRDANGKLLGLLFVLCLMPSMAFASPVNNEADYMGVICLVLGLLYGLLLGLTVGHSWAKFGERTLARFEAWTRPARVPLGAVVLVTLSVLLFHGCASAQMRLGREPRPLSPDPEVVESLLCMGRSDDAARYVELRGGSQADRIEAIERARKAVAKRPGCCAAEGKCSQ